MRPVFNISDTLIHVIKHVQLQPFLKKKSKILALACTDNIVSLCLKILVWEMVFFSFPSLLISNQHLTCISLRCITQ